MNRNNYYASRRITPQVHDLLHQYLLLRQGAMADDASSRSDGGSGGQMLGARPRPLGFPFDVY